MRSALQEFGRGYTFPRAAESWGQGASWLDPLRSLAVGSMAGGEGSIPGSFTQARLGWHMLKWGSNGQTADPVSAFVQLLLKE